jgi:hypothetical protein
MRIVDDVVLEDISGLLSKESFATWKGFVGTPELERLDRIRYALVRRFDSAAETPTSPTKPPEKVGELMACLRLIRPMREHLGLFHGRLRNDGSIEIARFSSPYSVDNVPELEKLFALRTGDALKLRELAPSFLGLRKNSLWKVIMAIEFYQAGFFQSLYWKARYSLRCSSIEAIFGSSKHRKSRLVKDRIQHLLGLDTCIYQPGDIPSHLPQAPEITVGTVLEDLFEARNCIAHGDRIPDRFFEGIKRLGVQGSLPLMPVLDEAASAIARRSILKILEMNVAHYFSDSDTADQFFAGI